MHIEAQGLLAHDIVLAIGLGTVHVDLIQLLQSW